MQVNRQRSTPNHPQLWKDGRRDDAGKTIARLMVAGKKQPPSISSATAVRFGWTLCFQNDLDFQALGAWSCDDSLNQSAIMRVLSTMLAEHSDATVDEFERIRAQLLSEVKQNAGASATWNFAYPLLIEVDPSIKLPIRLVSRGRRFILRPWGRVLREIGARRAGAAIKNRPSAGRAEIPSYCLVVSEWGPDSGSAWAQIEPSLDCLRAAIEFSVGFMGKSFRSHEGPMHRVPRPQWMLTWGSGLETVEAIEFAVPNAKPLGSLRLDAKVLDRCQTHLRRFVQEPDRDNDARRVVLDSLRLYIQALDAERTAWAFVGFWQMAEAMTLGEDHYGSGNTTCPRLAAFSQDWGIDQCDAEDILKSLYKKRNEMVHRGRHERIEQDDVNWLKNFCEMAYVWLAKNATKLKTRDALAFFFELRSANDSRIEASKRAVQLVESARRNRAGK